MAHDHGHPHGHDHHDHDDGELAELVDLDTEVLHGYLADVISWIEQVHGSEPRRILDLGAGTATASIALAQRFTGSGVTAVDQSDQMLARAAAKIELLGLTGRVITVQADLDEGWPELGPVDVAWASLSLHHMGDPDRVLSDVFTTVRPGGLMVIAEMDAMPRFLPDDIGIGRPNLEVRCHQALDAGWRAELPELGSDWGSRLATAGFTPVDQRVFDIDLTEELPPAAARYAQVWLQRIRSRLGELLDADDLATLDALIDDDGEHSVLHRKDLVVRCVRTVWIGHRP